MDSDAILIPTEVALFSAVSDFAKYLENNNSPFNVIKIRIDPVCFVLSINTLLLE